MKVSDYIADCIASLGIRHVFSVSGGGSMHLVDSIGKHKDLTYVACHHEQAAAMAAEAYSRLNGIGCALVTTGPGGTNALTGVAAAWIDSTPLLVISGQVTRNTLLGGTGLRQMGVQETDIVSLVKPITKYAITVMNESLIRGVLDYAVHAATSGRPGPVWVDVPLDIQAKEIEPSELTGYCLPEELTNGDLPAVVGQTVAMLRAAKRPVLIIGGGARNAKVRELVDALGIPVISSWAASDTIADHPCHIGHMGLFGDRAGNFAVQSADLLLVIGCRLSIPMIGHNFAAFAPGAKIIMVDVDTAEMSKPSLRVMLRIAAGASAFVERLLPHDCGIHMGWTLHCQSLRNRYPVCLPKYVDRTDGVNSYRFIDLLSDKLPDDAVVVVDTGTSFTCTYQAAKMKRGQRWINASGHAAMGYALPAAVGAAFATGKKIICITGDGGLQFNVQELATIAHHKLPITIFVLNNGGYLTITAMQDNHFGRRVGSDKQGLTFPNLHLLACAYAIPYWRSVNHSGLGSDIDAGLSQGGPCVIEIVMPQDQPLVPRVMSIKNVDGSVSGGALEDMFPYLSREELAENMGVSE